MAFHPILKRMRRRSKRLADVGSSDAECGAGPPPSGGDRGRGGGSVGAARSRTSQGTRVQGRDRVDAAAEGLVSLPGGLEPIAHGMAADEARADLLGRELLKNSC
jgi:hypothetical protein